MGDTTILNKELERLQKLHLESDQRLTSLMRETIPNHLQIQRVKKEKLGLKDQIEVLKNRLLPDIIA